jgi:hypothetical protein
MATKKSDTTTATIVRLTSKETLALAKMERDEAVFTEIFEQFQAAVAQITGTEVTEDEAYAILKSGNFYLPSLLVTQEGFKLSTGQKTLPIVVPVDYVEIKKIDKKGSYIVVEYGAPVKLTQSYRILAPDSISPRDVVNSIDPANPDATVAYLLSVIAPPPITNLPDGDYTITEVDINEKSADITTEAGDVIRVAKHVNPFVKVVRSLNGCIYEIDAKNPKRLKAGISMFGQNAVNCCEPVDKEGLGCKVGDTWEFLGVSELRSDEYNPMQMAKGILNGKDTHIIRVDLNIALGISTKISLGKEVKAEITEVMEPSATGKYKKPKFQFI